MSSGQELTPDPATGWIDRKATGELEIQGQWYTFADSFSIQGGHPGPGDCQTRGGHAESECSIALSNDPRSLDFPVFPETPNLGMCLLGVAAKIIAGVDGQPDYDAIWGLGIGMQFNLPDWPEPRTWDSMPQFTRPYDAVAHGVTGIAFEVDSEPAPRGGLRIALRTTITPSQAPWWGGAKAGSSPIHAGHNEFRWADVGGPNYGPQPPPAFDPTQLLGLVIVEASDIKAAKAVSFCIHHLTLLTDP